MVHRHGDVHALNAVGGDTAPTHRPAKVRRGRSGRRPRPRGVLALGDVLPPSVPQRMGAVSKLNEDSLGVDVPLVLFCL